jgi:hypothetical protein
LKYYIWYLQVKTLPLNKVGCTREYKTKLRICFDIPLICTTFAAVECVFAYRCLFPYLTKVKLGCTRKRKQVFFSLVSTSFAAHLQHAHADGLLNNGLHFEEEKKGVQN